MSNRFFIFWFIFLSTAVVAQALPVEADATAGASNFELPAPLYGRSVIVSNRGPNAAKALQKRYKLVEQYQNQPNLKWAKKIYRYNKFFIRIGLWEKNMLWQDINKQHLPCLQK